MDSEKSRLESELRSFHNFLLFACSQSSLRNAKLSLLIRIVNLTGRTLVCDSQRTCRSLIECLCVEFPREVILPYSAAECGVSSDRFGLKNYSGKIFYVILPDSNQQNNVFGQKTLPSHLVFSFEYLNNPPVAKHKISGVHIEYGAPGSLIVTK